MSSDLTLDDVRKVARLCRLDPSDDQLRRYAADLGDILRSMDDLASLDLEGVTPLSHPLDRAAKPDPDVTRAAMPVETLMRLAPDTLPPFIRVPKVLTPGGDA